MPDYGCCDVIARDEYNQIHRQHRMVITTRGAARYARRVRLMLMFDGACAMARLRALR